MRSKKDENNHESLANYFHNPKTAEANSRSNVTSYKSLISRILKEHRRFPNEYLLFLCMEHAFLHKGAFTNYVYKTR